MDPAGLSIKLARNFIFSMKYKYGENVSCAQVKLKEILKFVNWIKSQRRKCTKFCCTTTSFCRKKLCSNLDLSKVPELLQSWRLEQEGRSADNFQPGQSLRFLSNWKVLHNGNLSLSHSQNSRLVLSSSPIVTYMQSLVRTFRSDNRGTFFNWKDNTGTKIAFFFSASKK